MRITKKSTQLTLENVNLKCRGGNIKYAFYPNGTIQNVECNIPDNVLFELRIDSMCDQMNETLAKSEDHGSIDTRGALRRQKELIEKGYIYQKYCTNPRLS